MKFKYVNSNQYHPQESHMKNLWLISIGENVDIDILWQKDRGQRFVHKPMVFIEFVLRGSK